MHISTIGARPATSGMMANMPTRMLPYGVASLRRRS